MAKTKAQLRERASHLLGLVPFNTALQTEDADRLDDAYDEVYEQLKEIGQATWSFTGSVPTQLVPHVAALVAEEAMDDYGVSDQRAARILRRSSAALPTIKLLNTPAWESLEDAEDF